MEEPEQTLMTPFDKMTSSESLRMCKLFLPYLPSQMQQLFGLYVKYSELQIAEHYFQTFSHMKLSIQDQKKEPFSMDTIFEEITPFLQKKQQKKIREMQQLMNVMNMVSSLDTDSPQNEGADLLSSLLSPEQLRSFQSYRQSFEAAVHSDAAKEKEV